MQGRGLDMSREPFDPFWDVTVFQVRVAIGFACIMAGIAVPVLVVM